ncbi:MAG: transcriptional regulator [Cellvibrio sp.]
MQTFPLLTDAQEAILYLRSNPDSSDAIRAYAIGICSKEGLTNKQLREITGIDKVYTLTHYSRVGKNLTEEELILWHRNPQRLSLGHMRAICKLSHKQREPLIRKALARHTPVSEFERIARGEESTSDTDIRRYQNLMSDAIGHPVNIRYNPASGKGALTLEFFNLDELDKFAELLGFNSKDYF